MRSWFHWGIVNIHGNNWEKGEEILEYNGNFNGILYAISLSTMVGLIICHCNCYVNSIGPTPPARTGHHRYIFLVFKQSGQLNYV